MGEMRGGLTHAGDQLGSVVWRVPAVRVSSPCDCEKLTRAYPVQMACAAVGTGRQSREWKMRALVPPFQTQTIGSLVCVVSVTYHAASRVPLFIPLDTPRPQRQRRTLT